MSFIGTRPTLTPSTSKRHSWSRTHLSDWRNETSVDLAVRALHHRTKSRHQNISTIRSHDKLATLGRNLHLGSLTEYQLHLIPTPHFSSSHRALPRVTKRHHKHTRLPLRYRKGAYWREMQQTTKSVALLPHRRSVPQTNGGQAHQRTITP